jgi:hypothetical protein
MKTMILALILAAACLPGEAGDLDTMGVTRLRANDPTLTGAGISVAQAEAQNDANVNDWEVNPPNAGPATNLFTWINTNGSSTVFPNSLGIESFHADQVGAHYYGGVTGVAPGALQVDNYEADYFIACIVQSNQPVAGAVVNQSFTYGPLPVTYPLTGNSQQTVDSFYDDYMAAFGILFCSAVNNGGQVCAPGTAYNGLGVGCYNALHANSSTGPTVDNGRSKPDLVAPEFETSFSTPYVAGATAVLFQSAARGDGGANTNAAGDMRTVKALLLNGALKPGDWTHTPTAPLDTRFGAGVLNLYYSQQQLAAGQQPVSVSLTVPSGPAHPPGTPSALIPSLLGWDYQTITSSNLDDAVNHYYFDTSTNPATALTLTATLVWNRASGETGINNLSLFLYNTATTNLVTNSVSTVDNVQHIYIPSLPRGHYDLQVVKSGGFSEVSQSETYALAFQFYPISPPLLTLSRSGATAVVSWPWTPTLFNLQQTASLTPPISWSPVGTVGLITNTTVSVALTPAATAFYRLSR